MKYAWIKLYRQQFAVNGMCWLLNVWRIGYCHWQTCAPSDRAQANATLDAQVAALHRVSKYRYSRNRILRDLRRQGKYTMQSQILSGRRVG